MKIRVYDDSIRLRLDRSEVEDIGEGHPVECCTRFTGGAEFRYRLMVADSYFVCRLLSLWIKPGESTGARNGFVTGVVARGVGINV